MGMFFKKKVKTDITKIEYDPEYMEAILKCNTCNRDRVAGIKDKRTGEFTEIATIRSDTDLLDFKNTYGIEHISEVYGW